MAYSKVGICNTGFIACGAGRITSFDDNSKEARLATEEYEKVRDDVMVECEWNVAIDRVELAASATTPSFGFNNAFVIPPDTLKVLEVDEASEGDWRRESNLLLTDLSTVKIRRIVRQADNEDTWPPKLCSAVSAAFAARVCWSLTQNENLKKMLESDARMKIMDAKSVDAQEGSTPEPEINDFLDARF